MPTDTFFGLSEEKRQKIIEAGKKEFSEHTFDLTSIKNISEDARISRGSFYQYFESKEDLLEYIIKINAEKKKKILEDILAEANGDIFEFCIYLYDSMTSKNEKDEDMIIFGKIFNNIMQSKEKRILEKNAFDLKRIFKLLKVDNLKVQDEEDIKVLMKMLVDLTLNSIVHSKVNDNKEFEREIFLKKLSFVKNGVMKK